MNNNILTVLFIGDVFGNPGLDFLKKNIENLKLRYNPDFIVVNGENSSPNGLGVTIEAYEEFKKIGVSVITTGNHAYDSRPIHSFITQKEDLLRPLNHQSTCPGKGYVILPIKSGGMIAILNLQGRVFFDSSVECPFKTVETVLTFLKSRTNLIFVDFHAEATSEKQTMGYFLDGKVSGVFGTHTHIQTADERILPQGTAYITDAGFVGALNSVIGDTYESILRRYLTHYKVAGKMIVDTNPPFVLCGVVVKTDMKTGKSLSIERIRVTNES